MVATIIPGQRGIPASRHHSYAPEPRWIRAQARQLTPLTARPGTIEPGRLVVDHHRDGAQFHGVGIQHYDGRYWAWGEDKSHGSLLTGVACYSSPDLATWTSHGHALARHEDVPTSPRTGSSNGPRCCAPWLAPT